MILIILINIPAVYQKNFGITGSLFAIMFAVQGVGIIIGQVINRNLIERIGIEKTAIIGSAALVVVSLAIVVISQLGMMGPWLLTALMLGHGTGYLVVYANAAALTPGPARKNCRIYLFLLRVFLASDLQHYWSGTGNFYSRRFGDLVIFTACIRGDNIYPTNLATITRGKMIREFPRSVANSITRTNNLIVSSL